jgi:hypothetical protein
MTNRNEFGARVFTARKNKPVKLGKRSVRVPPYGERCEAAITMSDGSGAQCSRKRAKDYLFCRQHAAMDAGGPCEVHACK